jgi:hypothetical protein
MKKLTRIAILLIISQFFCAKAAAQKNLVPNGSFEEYQQCPFSLGFDAYVLDWKSARETPDYFNACATTWGANVPFNYYGYQEAASGNAYIAMLTFKPDSSGYTDPEAVTVKLINPLVVGQAYYVSFKTSLINRLSEEGLMAQNKIGVQFSTIEYNYQTHPMPFNNHCHICTDSIITDSLNWTHVKGAFIADSAYSYLILGSFFEGQYVDVVGYGEQYAAYYYFDDIKVSTDSSFVYSNIQESIYDNFLIYPTFASDFIKVEFEHNKEYQVLVYNSIGRLVLTHYINQQGMMDISFLPKGLYFIKTNGNSIINRFIIY